MTVREFITELLDYDMEHEVNVSLDLNNGTFEESFELDDAAYISETLLKVELSDYELVEKKRLEHLEELEDEMNG